MSNTSSVSAPALAGSAGVESRSARLVSLDAFRGLTMALMVLVNDPGGPHNYGQLEHSAWNGWTATDTVFPSFLWIVGIAITLSFARRLESGVQRSQLLGQVFRRAAILYALGLFIYLFPEFHWGTMRVFGVLQRIAICYLIASVIYLFTGLRGQIAWIIGLFASYWMLMTLVPVPGYGPGNLSIPGNLAHYVDYLVLGQHNYAETKTWDPEGIISTLPAIATALLGLLAGQLLRQKWSLRDKVLRLSLMGICLIAAGLIVSNWLPINKKLWTDSFSLFMAGLDSVILSIFIWFVDGLGWKRIVKPFVIFGMNAITIYVLSEVLAIILDRIRAGGISVHSWIYQHYFASLGSPQFASFCDAFCYVLLMFVFAYALYRKRIFIRI